MTTGPGRVGTALLVAAAICGGCGRSGTGIRTLTIFDFLEALPGATVQRPEPNYVAVTEANLAGDTRPALFMHPSSSAEFPAVRLEPGAAPVLTFGIGILSAAWDKPGDGVEFHVSLRTDRGTKANVFQRYIDPKHHPDERHWIDVRLPLRLYAGETVHVTLATSPGPAGDVQNDWAVWATPYVVLDDR